VGELGRSTLPESWQSSDEERGELRALAFGEHLAFPLSRIAQRRFLAGRPTEALTFYRAASSLEPESPWHAASMCLTLGRLERCEEARQELERARRLAQDASADEDLEELMADAERAQRSCERRARRAAK
jgi:predicted Zn-dependent protease